MFSYWLNESWTPQANEAKDAAWLNSERKEMTGRRELSNPTIFSKTPNSLFFRHHLLELLELSSKISFSPSTTDATRNCCCCGLAYQKTDFGRGCPYQKIIDVGLLP